MKLTVDVVQEYPSGNGYHAEIEGDRVRIWAALGGERRSWVDFDLLQMDGLIDHLRSVRDQLEQKLRDQIFPPKGETP